MDQLSKLDLSDGDIVLWRSPDGASYEAMSQASEWMKSRGFKNVLVIVLNGKEDLTLLDEAQMRDHGWMRTTDAKGPDA